MLFLVLLLCCCGNVILAADDSALTEQINTYPDQRKLQACCAGQGYNYCRLYYWANCCRDTFCCSNCRNCENACDSSCDYFSCPGYKGYFDPTAVPTAAPTHSPTVAPTPLPTAAPTWEPTQAPSELPDVYITERPTEAPTVTPTEQPTGQPTHPTPQPTQEPRIEYIYRYLTDKVDFSQPDVYIGFGAGFFTLAVLLKGRQWCCSARKVEMAPPKREMQSLNP